jgi:hypothetical protein
MLSKLQQIAARACPAETRTQSNPLQTLVAAADQCIQDTLWGCPIGSHSRQKRRWPVSNQGVQGRRVELQPPQTDHQRPGRTQVGLIERPRNGHPLSLGIDRRPT